jgi:NADH-quinone oxidoreductase subunit A
LEFSVPSFGIQQYLPLIFIFLLGGGFAGAFLLLSYSFGPKKPDAEKLDVYECGVPITGDARERFSVKFFLIAMIFLIFDVEVVFLFPWAVLLKEFKAAGSGLALFIPMLIFLVVLGVGLLYEWRRGTLDWET